MIVPRLLDGRCYRTALIGMLLGCGLIVGFAPPQAASSSKVTPRLVVLLVFDQLRGDYLDRWRDLFGPNGFNRVQREGISYSNCHYPYAYTVTGAGHASIATGCDPSVHGIVGNEWYDRTAAKQAYCVASDRHSRVPPVNNANALALVPGTNTKEGVSPERLLVPGIADALKKATANHARVVSLSLKDRSAVLPAGRRPDACYWFDSTTGDCVTSSYYRERPHSWVEEYNRSRRVDRFFGKDWDRLRPDLDYIKHSGPDDVVGEGTGIVQGRTFPHPTAGGLKQPGRAYYEALANSPFGNDVLLDVAKLAVERQELGKRDVPDLLCVSFSSNDLVGHTWGPDSQEVLDVTLRSDRQLAELLAFLDEQVGKGKYLLAITSDHGVCPLPEVTRATGKDAGRIAQRTLVESAEKFLTQRFSAGSTKVNWFEPFASPWLYLNRQTMSARQLNEDDVAAVLAGWLKQQPGIQSAYTRQDLQRAELATDPTAKMVRKCFHPERCGDLFVVLKPNYLVTTSYLTGTTHGTPHPYDTHVPLLFSGPGIATAFRSDDPVAPSSVAAVIAKSLGINPPEKAHYQVPAGAFAGR